MEIGWFDAVDVRLARPFKFASCDNPNGETEVCTPQPWSESESATISASTLERGMQ